MNSSYQMQPYDELLAEILYHGETQLNKRTGTECKVIIGTHQKYDLREGFPALTTRKLPIRNIIGELVGFFRGYDNAEDFKKLGCGIWDMNANETSSWINSPMRKGHGDLGRIYGSNWTSWEASRMLENTGNIQEQITYLNSLGWDTRPYESQGNPHYKDGQYILATKRINQLEEVVKRIMTEPSDRRILMTGWNPGGIEFQCLPACHLTYKFTPMQNGVMHLVMDMRSMDFFLGTPANIVSASILLEIVCRLTGYQPGTLTIQGANTHLYENSYDAARQLIVRKHSKYIPTLELSSSIVKLESLDEIKGCFAKIETSDIYLTNYYPSPAIAVKMVA